MVQPLIFGFDINDEVGGAFYFVLALIVFDVFIGMLLAGKERRLNSSINLDGLIRKVGLVTGLAFVTLVDYYLQMSGVIIKVAVGLLIAYEGLSIIENLDKIGVNLKFLTKYFDPDKVGKRDDE